MYRTLALVSTLLLLLIAPRAGLAQDATPGAAGVGAAVPYVDADGIERGSVSVTEVADPFEDFDPNYPPEDGSRYIQLTVAFEATGQQPFEADPYDLLLQDTNGYLWGRASVPRPQDAALPELQSQALAPGNRISGVIGFVVPADAELDNVFYQPESGRLIGLADLRPNAPSPSAEITYRTPEGGEALVAVTDFADPFEGFNPDSPPEAGSRYVLLSVTFENTGQQPIEADPYDLLLRDADGYLWQRGSVPLPQDATVPELQSQTMAPGNRISGVVGFVLPADAAVAGIYYQPESSRLLLIAAVRAADSAALAAESAAAGEECAGVEAWLRETVANLARAAELSREDAELPDQSTLEAHAAEYAELAAGQGALNVPSVAAAANEAAVATLTAYADALNQILQAGSDATMLTTGMNMFNDAGAALGQVADDLEQLATACGVAS